MFGAGATCADFIYAYVGHSLGGGLVFDHHLFPGRNRMAGSLGELPVHFTGKRGDRLATLREVASLHSLASKFDGRDRDRILSSPADWGDLGGVLEEWVDQVADGLAQVTRAAVALIDVDNVVIDGAIPVEVRKEIAKATRRKLARVLTDRPEPFSVLEGKFGHLAPAIGGASIPLLVKYSNDKESLFKD